MKRVFIIHRWGESPDSDWYKEVKREIEASDEIEVFIPEMPNTNEPKIDEWTAYLENVVSKFDPDTYFIAHSIGCQTLMRILEDLPDEIKIGGAVFVTPWLNLKGLESKKEEDIARPWLINSIELSKVKQKILEEKLICIFSDNDPFVMIEDADIFKEKLGAKIIIKEMREHITDEKNAEFISQAFKELLG